MGNEGKIVSVVTYNVTAHNIEPVIGQARHLVQDVAPTLRGFIEGVLLTSEDRTQVVVTTHWESRDDWAGAEWDEQISRGVVDLYEETASYTIKQFHEVARAARVEAT